jgi:hypothetical protein
MGKKGSSLAPGIVVLCSWTQRVNLCNFIIMSSALALILQLSSNPSVFLSRESWRAMSTGHGDWQLGGSAETESSHVQLGGSAETESSHVQLGGSAETDSQQRRRPVGSPVMKRWKEIAPLQHFHVKIVEHQQAFTEYSSLGKRVNMKVVNKN